MRVHNANTHTCQSHREQMERDPVAGAARRFSSLVRPPNDDAADAITETLQSTTAATTIAKGLPWWSINFAAIYPFSVTSLPIPPLSTMMPVLALMTGALPPPSSTAGVPTAGSLAGILGSMAAGEFTLNPGEGIVGTTLILGDTTENSAQNRHLDRRIPE